MPLMKTITQRTQRQQQILAQLRALQSELSVDELAKKFDVSGLTIRRDLEELERRQVVVRTYGGCVLRGTVESAYQRRVALNFELKQAIGRAAAKEIKSGETVVITYGSTVFHLAAHLGDIGKLFVYTDSLPVISELSQYPEMELYILGGKYIPPKHYLGGSMMERALEGFHFDSVFLSTDAIDAKGNCLVDDLEASRVAEVMLRRSTRHILLADHTKVGANAHIVYARLSDFDVWYTTSGINLGQLKRFRHQTTVRVVKP